MAVEELVELRFRLADGSDIGPSKYNSSATVTSLKEKIIAQWPKGNTQFSLWKCKFIHTVGLHNLFRFGFLFVCFALMFSCWNWSFKCEVFSSIVHVSYMFSMCFAEQ